VCNLRLQASIHRVVDNRHASKPHCIGNANALWRLVRGWLPRFGDVPNADTVRS